MKPKFNTFSSRCHTVITVCCSVLAGTFLAVLPASAQTTFTNGAGGNTWSTPGNWDMGEPLAGTNAILPTPVAGIGTITLAGNEVANSLTANASYILTGGTNLALTTGNVAVAGGATLTLNSVLAGGAGLGLSGGGTLVLGAAANTFTGNIVVNGAGTTLSVVGQGNADPTRLGSGQKTLTLQNGGKLLAVTTTAFDPSANTKSVVIGTGGGTIEVSSTSNAALLNDAGQFSGSGLLTKTGVGTLTIGQQTTGFTGFTGGAMVNQGTLQLGHNQALGGVAASIITLNGGNLNLRFDSASNFSNNTVVSANATINVNRNGTTQSGNTLSLGTLSIGAQTLTVSGGNNYALSFGGATTLTGNAAFAVSSADLTLTGPVGGAFGLTKTGTGTLTLSSGTSDFNGGLTIGNGSSAAGIVRIGASSTGAPGAVTARPCCGTAAAYLFRTGRNYPHEHERNCQDD